MKTTYIGELKVIEALGRKFVFTEESHNAVVAAEWAHNILAQPATTFLNGRDSHEVAGDELDRVEDILLDFQLFYA
jgi:hypothetical protein